jgi:BirA family transcriptional regulator, biotin operon repressor / biotin---[acetyl-CoA-carboxylase] ligase
MPFALGPRARSAGYRLAAYDSIGSTNAEALLRARSGERSPTWFVTSDQTAGRGRRHRAWIAPRGNLACSVLETLDTSPAIAATLGFAAGLALEAALQKASHEGLARGGGSEDLKFSLKWPNDVLAGHKKLAGILLEAEAMPDGRLAVVVGIGTNVIGAPEGTPTPATSLKALGVAIGAEELFATLSDSWAEFRSLWGGGQGFGEIRRLWLARAAGLGEAVKVRTGGSTIAGTFDTIDDAGSMIVRTTSGNRIAVTAGDVYFGSAASVGAA